MLFQTTQFLIFIAIFIALYLLVRANYWLRNGLLLGASYAFYAFWDWKFLWLILASTVADFYLGKLIARAEEPRLRKLCVWISIVLNLGLLATFKYYDFFIASLADLGQNIGWTFHPAILRVALPVGISFYTFESMSYIIDVYRRKIPVADNLLEYAVFISFFPHLVAGPIIRPATFFPSLRKTPEVSEDVFYAGLYRFMVGLFKKLIIADLLALWWVDEVFSNSEFYSPVDVLIAGYSYAFQIYNDFSAYSDMAIALSMMLGIYLPENFESPYVARSLKDFWRRWHISLSTWLRDYLYIPLGGSRSGLVRKYFSIFVTMLLGGLWHGANWTFVIWGAVHGAFIVLNHMADDLIKPIFPRFKLPYLVGWFATFNIVCFAWIFFRAENLASAKLIVAKLTLLFSAPGSYHGPRFILALLVLGLLGQFLSFTRVTASLSTLFLRAPLGVKAAAFAVSIGAIVVFEQHFKPFIYFQF